MAADSQKRDVSMEEREQAIGRLCQEGGVVVVCETVVTLLENDQEEQKWTVVEYGIPAVVRSKGNVMICIADVESGETVREITVDSGSRYQIREDHFHVLVPSEGSNQQCYGFSFVDVSVAKKVFSAVKQLARFSGPGTTEDGSEPTSSKRQKLDADGDSSDDGLGGEWVVIDTPPKSRERSPGGGGVAETENQPAAGEGVDSPFGFGRKRKKETRVMEISAPKDFRHIAHVGSESSIGVLTSVITGQGSQEPGSPGKKTESESSSKTTKSGGLTESGTKRSSSFEELEPAEVSSTTPTPKLPPVPSPTRKRLPSETRIPPEPKIGLHLPEPPPLSDHEALLVEITTFDRTKLRRITAEEIAKTKNMPDSQERSVTLNSLLRSGLDKMRSKLQLTWQLSRMGSISSNGEEDGFDEFDFPLFVIEDCI